MQQAKHTSGAMNVAAIATGVAKAAFDHAFDYARSREQGGATLIAHQHVRWRLWEMWRKLETCRASVRRGAAYNFSEQGPHLLASITAKTTATQAAFEVAMEAIQIFGANGLARDFAVERLLRDIAVCLIQGEKTIHWASRRQLAAAGLWCRRDRGGRRGAGGGVSGPVAAPRAPRDSHGLHRPSHAT
jgi:alkylation response protein AidB-like acyl-CoA dehydrogenase